jgi:hypothetical protein
VVLYLKTFVHQSKDISYVTCDENVCEVLVGMMIIPTLTGIKCIWVSNFDMYDFKFTALIMELYAPLKRRSTSMRIHCVVSQKTIIFKFHAFST